MFSMLNVVLSRKRPDQMPQPTVPLKMGSRKQLFNNGSDGGGGKESGDFNIALIGAQAVGKSAITVKYITKRFIMEYDPTLEGTFSKIETIDGREVTIRLMDTYDTETSNPDRYLKWAHAFIVVYSITSQQSLDTAKNYLETINQYQRITGKDIPISLVGNKTDLERYRTVSKMLGEAVARQYECSFHETSASEEFGSVETVFHNIVRDLVRLNDRLMPLQPLFISEDKSSLLSPVAQAQNVALTRTSFRRAKSPKTQDASKKDEKLVPRRAPSTFKIFNKSFKIFN